MSARPSSRTSPPRLRPGRSRGRSSRPRCGAGRGLGCSCSPRAAVLVRCSSLSVCSESSCPRSASPCSSVPAMTYNGGWGQGHTPWVDHMVSRRRSQITVQRAHSERCLGTLGSHGIRMPSSSPGFDNRDDHRPASTRRWDARVPLHNRSPATRSRVSDPKFPADTRPLTPHGSAGFALAGRQAMKESTMSSRHGSSRRSGGNDGLKSQTRT